MVRQVIKSMLAPIVAMGVAIFSAFNAEVAQLAVDGELPIRGAKRKPVPVLAEAEFEALHPGSNIDVSTFKDGKPGTFAFLDGKTKGFMLLVK